MPAYDAEMLRSIRTFPSLLKYLRDELDWPIDEFTIDDITYDYDPEDLGIDPKTAAKIQEIKQLRPLVTNQPWGIFFIKFEPKRLPVVALRKILSKLVIKKRASAQRSEQASWHANDLLFISNYGEGDDRQITFAQFSEDEEELPALKVLGWDDADTVLHLDYAHKELKKYLRWPEDINDFESWREQWSSAFTTGHREVIKNSKYLSECLAQLATEICRRVQSILQIETDKGALRKVYADCRAALIHDLTQDDFADMYAQTITYGLLTARISQPDKETGKNVSEMIPVTNPFLRDLLSTFLTIGGRKGKIDFDEVGINDVIQTLNNTDIEAVLRDFGDRKPEEDPVIFFYEDFLKAYDPQRKVKRGVFYTPRPVVSFIVRSVHELLQKEFGLEDGLADTTTWGEMAKTHKDMKLPEGVKPSECFVQILDPATGTGTFLVEVIEVIHNYLIEKWKKQGKSKEEQLDFWNDYVPKYLLPRLYGYELMMAPYAIAHMKVGLKLHETGYDFGSNERARIYLTNALEPPIDTSELRLFSEAFAHEAQEVNEIKIHRTQTVIIGNPPYAGESANKGSWIEGFIDDYKAINGESLGEKNIKWINDDYVKFIRLAQLATEKAGQGIVGLITNHAYLDNPTFRGMRKSLIDTFDEMYVLDLHGSIIKREKCPDGTKDEGVFDIQIGTAVTLYIKKIGETERGIIRYCEFWGLREDEPKENSKYWLLLSNSINDLSWRYPSAEEPFFFLVEKDEKGKEEYYASWSIVDIFKEGSVGIVTSRDSLLIHYTKSELIDTILGFASLGPEAARKRYALGKDVQDWKVSSAQSDVRTFIDKKSKQIDLNRIQRILYRPFDTRFIYYTGNSRGLICRPRKEVMQHMINGKNIGLITARSNKSDRMDHFFVTDSITEAKCGESTTQSALFPLYLYPAYEEQGNLIDCRQGDRKPNLSSGLLSALKGAYKRNPTAEEVFFYIYAVLFSNIYRTRYGGFIKYDYPRVPFPSIEEVFNGLSLLGKEIANLHINFDTPKVHPTTTFKGKGNSRVEKVKYDEDNHRIYINKAQFFDNVPQEVWEYYIGGYQVCDKWLKERKKRYDQIEKKLWEEDKKKAERKVPNLGMDSDEIMTFRRILEVLKKTIEIQAEIDEIYPKVEENLIEYREEGKLF